MAHLLRRSAEPAPDEGEVRKAREQLEAALRTASPAAPADACAREGGLAGRPGSAAPQIFRRRLFRGLAG